MTAQIVLLFAIIGVSLTLFSLERLPADVVALGTLLSLILTGLLPVERAFVGFGSETVVMMFGLLILTAALVRTGVVDAVGRFLARRAGNGGGRLPAAIYYGRWSRFERIDEQHRIDGSSGTGDAQSGAPGTGPGFEAAHAFGLRLDPGQLDDIGEFLDQSGYQRPDDAEWAAADWDV